jgi:hypothetical protein
MKKVLEVLGQLGSTELFLEGLGHSLACTRAASGDLVNEPPISWFSSRSSLSEISILEKGGRSKFQKQLKMCPGRWSQKVVKTFKDDATIILLNNIQ